MIQNGLTEILSALQQKDLGTAIIVMENYLATNINMWGGDQLESIKNDYQLMVDFWLRGFDDEQHAPTHYEIYGERQFGQFAHGEDFIECAAYDGSPLQPEYSPSEPSAYHRHADGGVGAGYHDVDADMVEFPHHLLDLAWPYPVIEGAGQEHEEHSRDEEYHSECPFPSAIYRRPRHPDAGQCEDHTGKVRPCVGEFSVEG